MQQTVLRISRLAAGMLAGAVTCMALPADALDLTYHPPQHDPSASIQAVQASLRCGIPGRPPGECLLAGTLLARTTSQAAAILPYRCTIHYSAVVARNFNLSFTNTTEEKTLPGGAPLQPGVGPQEKTGHPLRTPDYQHQPATPGEPARTRGIIHHFGTMPMKDGRGERNLAEGPPLMVPEQATAVRFESMECAPDRH